MNMRKFNRLTALLLAAALLLSYVSMGAAPVNAASASDYISTTYAANLSVKTTSAVSLMTYPTTASASTAKYTLPADTMLSVKALHKNTSGTYWYEVLYYNMTMYVDATATTMVDHLTGDVTITGVQSPASVAYGDSFGIKGDIKSTLNDLGTVTAAVYTNSNITKAPYVESSDEVNGKSYSLAGSTVDYNLPFNTMAAGIYTYVVTAEAISYYIDDNDVLATSAQTVVLERQQCVITDWTNPNDALAFGIDVSTWNGVIDWSAAKNDIDYAILRIGYEYTMDDTFLYNAKGCMANDIPFGIYIYSYAESEAEAIGEAEFVISALRDNGLEPELPLWFDMEDEVHVNLSSSVKEEVVRGFCDTIAAAGYEPGLYTFRSWFTSHFAGSYFSSLPQWVAQIDGFSSNGTSTYDGGTWQWQFSWEGVISGISGAVDCNYYYAEFPGFSSDTSYLSQCTYYPAHSVGATTASVNMRQYPSTSYTSLGTVASGTTLEITGLYKNASGEYWYQVVNGDTAGYILSDYVTISEFLYDDLAVIDPAMASNVNLGSAYPITGNMVSQYNNIYTACAKVYSGEDTLADPVLSSGYTTNSKVYDLYSSEVDYDLPFNQLASGYYTYEISADVKNYYVSSGSLTSTTENVVVWTAPFTVGSAPIEPPAEVSCAHNIVTDAAVAATCQATGLTEGSHCSKCGVVFTAQTVVPISDHSYGNWNTVNAATCTVAGTQSHTCTVCGKTETQTIAATGHDYTHESIEANCQEYEQIKYTCGTCGYSYSVYADELMSEWSETKPEGVDESLIESKTQYRYSDYETTTSYNATLAGYTLLSSTWEKSGSGIINYVKSWPSGFDTSNSLYTTYNKTPKSASTTTTAKTTVDSNAVTGYIYYHWCDGSRTDGPWNRLIYASKTTGYETFHAFYSSTELEYTDHDTSDDSYALNTSDCSDCCTTTYWYFVVPVYKQTYTTYKALFTYYRWTDYSDWSDDVVTASDTRKVETRTVYRYSNAELGDHVYANGVCTVCGAACPGHNFVDSVCTVCDHVCSAHNYVNGYCSICGAVTPITDYYLFGYINGANYACEEDAANMGEYKFVDGQLTVTFTQDSYVAVKTNDNLAWYMTNGWLGYVTSATLYNTSVTGENSNKLYVPGGVEVTFTLVDNGDNTFYLSYVANIPEPEVNFLAASLSLAGNIGMNVYVQLDDELVADAQTHMVFTYADKTQTIALADATPTTVNGVACYMFACDVWSTEMAEIITAQVYYSKGAVGDAKNCGVQDYCRRVFNYVDANGANSPAAYLKVVPLLKAILNYGANAQIMYTSYTADTLANSILSAADQVLPSGYDVTAYKPVVSGSEDGIAVAGVSLVLDSTTSIRYFFTLTGSKTIDQYTFLVDGKEVEPVAYGSQYYVELSDVISSNLDVAYVAQVGGLSVSYSGMSFVYQVSKMTNASTELKNLAAALYDYCDEANNYVK